MIVTIPRIDILILYELDCQFYDNAFNYDGATENFSTRTFLFSAEAA